MNTDAQAQEGIELTQRDDESVDVVVNGVPFTSYIQPAIVKKPILYPLRTARGTAVTRGFPLETRPGEAEDHPHQVGHWLTYGSVNGLDFWGNREEIPPEERDGYGTIRHRGVTAMESGADAGRLDVNMAWQRPDGSTVLHEDTRFVFRGTATARSVDRVTRLTALEEDVVFADTKEGMMGVRVARQLRQPAADGSDAGEDGPNALYRSSEGLEGDAVWSTRAAWVRLSGHIGPEAVTIAIMDHPANPWHPTHWHARGYGLFAVNPLGVKDFTGGASELNFTLPAGDSVLIRYRILIESRDDFTDEELNSVFASFGAEEEPVR